MSFYLKKYFFRKIQSWKFACKIWKSSPVSFLWDILELGTFQLHPMDYVEKYIFKTASQENFPEPTIKTHFYVSGGMEIPTGKSKQPTDSWQPEEIAEQQHKHKNNRENHNNPNNNQQGGN